MSEAVEALVIGAGPAGLMAAEMLAGQGAPVVLAEAMPTPARKLLMAGKSGLNLTMNEPSADFLRHYGGSAPGLRPPPEYLENGEMGPAEVMDWARGLGVELFVGSTGRVFPVGMKASPLLRAWLARLSGLGVELRTRWRWTGFRDEDWGFEMPGGVALLRPRVVVLALGGASWPRLGSDAAWVPWLRAKGVTVAPFRPANMGFRVTWSAPMARHFGQAVKGVALHVGDRIGRGEWVVTAEGVEGGGIYEVAAAIREGAAAFVDLAPDLAAEELARRFAKAPAKLSVGNRLRRVLGDPLRAALLMEWGRPLPAEPERLAMRAKALHLRHDGPMGIARAISSAGGIAGESLTATLELKALPGVFAAGEMLDWEAPTGGYLLTGCLATGRLAGRGAAAYLAAARR
ncbi:NAD(P)/FAD-dependent oxidoreductase [Paracoccus thiocyanatus]|uniref:Aminoacetone oxidase family FAD-binding enzyme n=1 Tax=Paracoccus thiocyanatus TaxID=34006 RepID=A0A3D8PDT2_9RHOB|nr:TIGR03862 family flavoprotein [Paracoccus thiocyanatus]RDW14224.1 aminoacetone oxidase family FAD-binding enzyme [Paracoccus thiocyanatus]